MACVIRPDEIRSLFIVVRRPENEQNGLLRNYYSAANRYSRPLGLRRCYSSGLADLIHFSHLSEIVEIDRFREEISNRSFADSISNI